MTIFSKIWGGPWPLCPRGYAYGTSSCLPVNA